MRRAILAGFALALLVSPLSADDALVREMELEITIRDLSRTVYADAKARAADAIKKTTLWKKWRTAREPIQPESEACRDALADRREYEEAYRRHYGADKVPPNMESFMGTIRSACRGFFARSRSPEFQRLRKAAESLQEEVIEVREMFVERIYIREMERRLVELKVKVTREVKQRLQQALKKHEA